MAHAQLLRGHLWPHNPLEQVGKDLIWLLPNSAPGHEDSLISSRRFWSYKPSFAVHFLRIPSWPISCNIISNAIQCFFRHWLPGSLKPVVRLLWHRWHKCSTMESYRSWRAPVPFLWYPSWTAVCALQCFGSSMRCPFLMATPCHEWMSSLRDWREPDSSQSSISLWDTGRCPRLHPHSQRQPLAPSVLKRVLAWLFVKSEQCKSCFYQIFWSFYLHLSTACFHDIFRNAFKCLLKVHFCRSKFYLQFLWLRHHYSPWPWPLPLCVSVFLFQTWMFSLDVFLFCTPLKNLNSSNWLVWHKVIHNARVHNLIFDVNINWTSVTTKVYL